jgi:hypothetical protein
VADFGGPLYILQTVGWLGDALPDQRTYRAWWNYSGCFPPSNPDKAFIEIHGKPGCGALTADEAEELSKIAARTSS